MYHNQQTQQQKQQQQQQNPFKWGFLGGTNLPTVPSNSGNSTTVGGGGRRVSTTTTASTATTTNNHAIGQPEAVLFHHSRAVNRLAWHCTGRCPGFLLTASQDATVKLWDRRSSSSSSTSASPSSSNTTTKVPPSYSHPRSQQVFTTHPNPTIHDKTTGSGWNWFGGIYSSSKTHSTPTATATTSNPSPHPLPMNHHRPIGLSSPIHSGTTAATMNVTPTTTSSWTCVNTFHPKCEAVRDICWSPFHDDVFAMVTDSGYLVVYDIRVMIRPWIKIAAHSGEATSVDWHPTRKYIIATGGGRDRIVKVWDIENGLSLTKNDENVQNIKVNSFSNRSLSDHSDSGTVVTATDMTSTSWSIGAHPDDVTVAAGSTYRTVGSQGTIPPSFASQTVTRSYSNAHTFHSRPHSKSAAINLHSLSISAPVTRLKWRPPARPFASMQHHTLARGGCEEHVVTPIDRHDAMLTVATAPISGANAGGVGSIGLWSYHRPFMPLSVVEGHMEGAVMDFAWVDTPPTEVADGRGDGAYGSDTANSGVVGGASILTSSNEYGKNDMSIGTYVRNEIRSSPTLPEMDDGAADLFTARTRFLNKRSDSSSSIQSYNAAIREKDNHVLVPSNENNAIERQNKEDWVHVSSTSGTWQHVLTVGRDGRCLLQSLARGERPISQVPPSAFAMANLSPFQKGFGSLQIMSVHQKVPSGQANDFALTGLRRDAGTSNAPGIFKEFPSPAEKGDSDNFLWNPKAGGQREPASMPKLEFYTTDRGDIEDLSSNKLSPKSIVDVAPEVVHLSRFAASYRLRRDSFLPTKASLCLHNATVAENLQCNALSRMWKLVASMLDGSCHEKSENMKDHCLPTNAMSFLLFPTLKSLLIQRADAGDVQTCVAICEVMEVILSPASPTSKTNQRGTQKSATGASQETLLPGLELDLVREWYLSYIELLQQMCLFSDATDLIRNCRDPVINALNQQSTTIHEACSLCKKPIQGVAAYSTEGSTLNETLLPTAQRVCKSCRRQIGRCWICHEAVKGIFVWCPGCGHGGHIDHTLEWFGGRGERTLRESCPTGCGMYFDLAD
uniref:GATOR complex protein WDR24 n=1 Tax=Ditylum brightwellii TaxID=49249 RepID=A0A6V2AHI3_9STRA